MDITTTYNNFQSEWIAKRVDYDHVYGYQCVDLIRQYMYECYGLGNAAGGVPYAISYWTNTPDGVYAKFFRVSTTNVVTGDVVVLNPTATNSAGHIGIATGNQTDTTYEMLEQNGGNGTGDGTGTDAIRTRFIEKSRIAGILRPVGVTVAPPYTTEVLPALRNLKINKETSRWRLTYYDESDMAANPVGSAHIGDKIVAVGIAHHVDGQDYFYNADGNDTGWNSHDCDDYNPSLTVSPPPVTPSIIASSPAPTVKAAQTYLLVKSLPTYGNVLDAQATQKNTGQLPAGNYYVWGISGVVRQISKDNIHEPVGQWINTLDNVVDETVPVKVQLKPSEVPIGAPDDKWKSTYKSFHADRTSDPYKTLQPIHMLEYSAKCDPVDFGKGAAINFVGTFVKDGVAFYRARDFKNDEFFNWWYGVSMYNDDGQPNVVKVTEDAAQVAERKIADYRRLWKDDIKDIWDIFWKKVK